MPFYYRNADGDELIFVHRGSGVIETDFGPLTFEPGDYLVMPRAVTYRIVPETQRQFLPDHSIAHGVRSAGQGPARPSRAVRSRRGHGRRSPTPHLDDNREWEVRIKVDDEISKVFYPFNPLDVVGWKGDLTVWKINMRDIRPGDEPSRAPAAQRAQHLRHRRRGGVQFSAAAARAGSRMRCACRSSIAIPITTSSSSTTTAISSARTTSSRATPRCIRAASITDRIPRRWPIKARRRTPTNTP